MLGAGVPRVAAQYGQTHNLTPDGYWHNMYHQILSMSAYGDYNYWCPNQTFTEASKRKNFPNSPRAPWTLVETWGPTASGAEGFSAVVPEMNKVLMVFRGNHAYEEYLPTQVVSWGNITADLGKACPGCTVNAFAAQGYNEARAQTNDFEKTRNAYYGQGLVFSITGHGLGGMHALIASVDFNQQDIAWYSHNYGTPRTFNKAGVDWYNYRFNGEAGERGIFANDIYVDKIPSGPNYAHAGTTFYYWGINGTTYSPNWQICWDDVDGTDPACRPGAQRSNNVGSNSTQDHYFYWANVQRCGGQNTIDLKIINSFLASNASGAYSPSILAALANNQSTQILTIGNISANAVRATQTTSTTAVSSTSVLATTTGAPVVTSGINNNGAATGASQLVAPTTTKPSSASRTTVLGSLMAVVAGLVGFAIVA
ncbi:hypothetical protein EMMF5_001525 [Cystobasidiomycetes sp. EMM_F5]